MTEHFKDGVLYLTFPSLDKEKWLVNAFSTRLGGVSKEHLSAMNFGLSKGDDPENLRENFRRFQAAVGFEADHIAARRDAYGFALVIDVEFFDSRENAYSKRTV